MQFYVLIDGTKKVNLCFSWRVVPHIIRKCHGKDERTIKNSMKKKRGFRRIRYLCWMHNWCNPHKILLYMVVMDPHRDYLLNTC